MSLNSSNPIEALAAALYSACLRDLPEINYQDLDHAVRRKHLDTLDQAARAEFIEREQYDDATKQLFIFHRSRRPTSNDCEVVAMFPQIWGSTATGFGGIGGAAMTSAYTTVINCPPAEASAVYFSGRFAYLVPHKLEDGKENLIGLSEFKTDLANNCLASVADQVRYTQAVAPRNKLTRS